MSGAITIQNRSHLLAARENLLNTDLVLIVDDDDNVLEVTAEIFLTLGYYVLTARNGLEAVAALRKNSRISVLFTDIEMPVMGGEQLAEIAAALRPGILVIFTSGCCRPRADAPFLQKPYGAVDVIRVLSPQPLQSPTSEHINLR